MILHTQTSGSAAVVLRIYTAKLSEIVKVPNIEFVQLKEIMALWRLPYTCADKLDRVEHLRSVYSFLQRKQAPHVRCLTIFKKTISPLRSSPLLVTFSPEL